MTDHHPPPTVFYGEALDRLRELPDASVDAIITDPPYGLSNTDPAHVTEAITQWVSGNREFVPHKRGGFMGKEWDSFVPPPAVWDECLRVLKPGGHLLAFAGTRTMDLMTLGLRLAGFDIRDSLAWLYGSGFPKSLDVSKAIDKAAGAEREVTGTIPDRWTQKGGTYNFSTDRPQEEVSVLGGPATDAAREWEGWGTALKPAFEPIVMARKPFKGTVAANVLEHGTGALNIDATRIHTPGSESKPYTVKRMKPGATLNKTGGNWRPEDGTELPWEEGREYHGQTTAGRWPANVVLDESQAAVLDAQSGESKSPETRSRNQAPREDQPSKGAERARFGEMVGYGDSGGASRFFYCAKAPKRERPVIVGEDGTKTAHPTVKPLALMRWLARLVTPPGGRILDPFVGSGTTAEAGMLEGFDVWAIEGEADYLPLIQVRVQRNPGGELWGPCLHCEDLHAPPFDGRCLA